ncbi:MAG: hypothetical protein JJE27_08115, partial [Thermoleophilia bacterium]|nr:hypothetical protein [Thermoleophilia bacterium]
MSIGTGIGAGLATALIATAALVGLSDRVTPERGRVTATQAEITGSELRW